MTKTKEKNYEIVSIKPIEKSQVEIVGSLPVEVWGAHRNQAIKNINEAITLDGFRKGMIPENILISKVGEMTILEEMAEIAMSKAYVDIVIDNKIDAVGRPSIQITKIAKDNPLEFKAITAVVPEIKLPDYKKIAKKAVENTDPKDLEVTEKDIEDTILRVRKSHASHDGHDHEKMTPEEHEKAIMDNLPELNDEFVKIIGDFNDVAEFKNRIKEMLAEEKKSSAKEKTRIKISDDLGEATKVEVPEIMITSEIDRIQSQFSADIERMGVKLDDYLKHAKKTIEEIRKEWTPHAEKKAKLQLILNAISKEEKLSPAPEEIEAEVNHILEHYKDADRERAYVYADTVLTNEKVFDFLENTK
jgi:FKBP-type peptidyl-prolyl cis-trans isomerase (trigger factor)